MMTLNSSGRKILARSDTVGEYGFAFAMFVRYRTKPS